MKNNNKWTVRDVITTVLLTVALILIQLVINMVCMVNDFVSMVLSVGITMLWPRRGSVSSRARRTLM